MENAMSFEDAVRSIAPAVKVVGGAGTGKTAAIVERIRLLVQEETGCSIVAFAATRSAACELRARINFDADVSGGGVLVTTPYEYAIEMLSCEEAASLGGRPPRLLEDFEQRILVEDLKVLGIKPRRLREMLKFFFRTYSELGDESPEFLQSSEEKMLAEAMESHLRARGAMLPAELTNSAVKYVRNAKSGAEAWKFDYVFADDVQNFSLATQTLIGLLARRQLFVCGNPNAAVATTEPYPYPDGLEAFEQNHADSSTFFLQKNLRSTPEIVAVGNALCLQDGMDEKLVCANTAVDGNASDGGSVRVVQWALPNAEFVNICKYVADRVKGNTDPLHPQDVYLAVPNALWGRALAKLLGDHGVKTASMLSYHALTGDPRDWDKCSVLRLFTLLNLASAPNDAAAWRSWCGFGDYLTHSNHWCRLEEYAQESGIGIVDALESLSSSMVADAEPFLGAHVLAQRYAQGRAILSAAQGKSGFSLIGALADNGQMPAGFAELVEPVTGTESAQELFERARAHAEIQFPDQDAVRIGLPQMVVGQQFDTVVITGFVDGFYPPVEVFGPELEQDRKEQIVADLRRGLYVATQAARRTLVLSLFHSDEVASAAKLGMHVHRIRDKNGKRMATLSPSSYLDEMGDAAPGLDSVL